MRFWISVSYNLCDNIKFWPINIIERANISVWCPLKVMVNMYNWILNFLMYCLNCTYPFIKHDRTSMRFISNVYLHISFKINCVDISDINVKHWRPHTSRLKLFLYVYTFCLYKVHWVNKGMFVDTASELSKTKYWTLELGSFTSINIIILDLTVIRPKSVFEMSSISKLLLLWKYL